MKCNSLCRGLLFLLLFSICVCNVSARIVQPGGTIYIGESNLDVSNCVYTNSIGWWPSPGLRTTTAASKIITVFNKQAFTASPANFVGYTGGWYNVNGATGKGFSIAFYVANTPPIYVKINGRNALTLSNPPSNSKSKPYSANVNLAGGTYKWEISRGADKVRIVGSSNTRSIELQPVAASAPSGNDVQLDVTYTFGTRTVKNSIIITVQQPTSLKIINGPTTIPISGGYETTVGYQVRDQSGLNPINDVMQAEEVWNLRCTNEAPEYKPPVTFYMPKTTSAGGTFADGFSPEPRILMPPDLYTCLNQVINVNGYRMPYRHIEYHASYATVSLGLCSC